MTSISVMFRPALASTLRLAGTGPMPMMRGATPAVAMATTRARGFRPFVPAAASLARSSAAAPSLTPEALPAVTVPSLLKGVGRLASFSRVVARGCSSVSTTTGLPLRCETSTCEISSDSLPSAIAAAARS